MALTRDKRRVLLTAVVLLGVMAFFQIVGYGKTTGIGGKRAGVLRTPIAQQQYQRKALEGRGCVSHICVYFDVTFDGEPGGRIIFLLDDKKAPKTAENFRLLATGERGVNENGVLLHYKNTTFHRVVHGLLVRGGDVLRGKGKEGEVVSVYGGRFLTERREDKFHQKGLLAMDSMGPDKNGSEFFVTVDAVPEIDGQYVVFGEVIEGMEVVERINNTVYEDEEIPRVHIVIADSGQL